LPNGRSSSKGGRGIAAALQQNDDQDDLTTTRGVHHRLDGEQSEEVKAE
jgi:hypothetical protein